jgi:hypothetical protein
VLLVDGPNLLRHQHLDVAADHFVRIETEQHPDCLAGEHDDPVPIDRDDGIR